MSASSASSPPVDWDVIVVGAGAAGLMAAIAAGRRGRRVLVLDHANKVGKKILMSGGGHCNFTNTGTTPAQYLSTNPHFCKSALARYTPQDFIDLVDAHGIAWHEKELGQLFCDGSSKQIVQLLLDEADGADVQVRTHCPVQPPRRVDDGFVLDTGGVLHDGSAVYPGALDALRHLKSRGKKVCLLTNQARRIASTARLLAEIGVDEPAVDQRVAHMTDLLTRYG